MSGYTGQVLRVNLTAGEAKTEPLDMNAAKKFLGGRGLGTYYFAKEVSPKVDPLSPENKIIFATGPLTGSPAPSASRYMVITKSPLSGTIACSNSGGYWGPQLKFAGYDMIIIEGKSPEPCYIAIRDDEVEIRDARKHWGGLVGKTSDALREEFGDQKARVLMIGPAGEHMSPIAAIMNDKDRAAGRSGVGAIMGSKNLKAIIVRGTKKIKPADPDKTKELIKTLRVKIKEHPVTGESLPTNGTAGLVNVINAAGLYPTENFQKSQFDKAEQVSGEFLTEKFLIGRDACYGCPIACGRRTRIYDEEGGGPEFETIWAFTADCGVSDMESVIKANRWCNEYGMDTISTGSTIACAMEMYQKGIIKDDELGGTPLEFGSNDAVVEWARKMGAGEGLGAKMALGSYRFAELYGVPELSMSVKKLELPAYDPRAVQGQGLQYATSNRGGCHVRGYIISPEVLGFPEKIDPSSLDGKAVWAKGFQDLTAAIDSLGMCLFTSFAFGAEEYCDLFNVIVGENWTVDDINAAGDRIWNIERMFNLDAGIGKEQDTLPRRLLREPISDGPAKGQVHRLDELLPEYYEIRGWDENGVPTDEKLAELGIG